MQKRQNLPIVCGTLVVINVIVYLICTFTGDLLYNIGELDAVAVLPGMGSMEEFYHPLFTCGHRAPF